MSRLISLPHYLFDINRCFSYFKSDVSCSGIGNLFSSAYKKQWFVFLLALLCIVLSGCEAALDLEGVKKEKEMAYNRTDNFQAAAISDSQIVVTGNNGVVLSSGDKGSNWTRVQLKGQPSLIDVASCPNGAFAALAIEGQVWVKTKTEAWQQYSLGTQERPQAITCDPEGRLWVVASFSTILQSSDLGRSWSANSLDEDMMLTHIQFFTHNSGLIAGEFGTLLTTKNGGASWEKGNPMPDEFFPLSAHFISPEKGWVASLNGAILETSDGGINWVRAKTDTKSPLYKFVAVGSDLYALGNFGTVLKRLPSTSVAVSSASENDEVSAMPLRQQVQQQASQWQTQNIGHSVRTYLRASVPVDGKVLIGGGSGALFMIDTDSIKSRKG